MEDRSVVFLDEHDSDYQVMYDTHESWVNPMTSKVGLGEPLVSYDDDYLIAVL